MKRLQRRREDVKEKEQNVGNIDTKFNFKSQLTCEVNVISEGHREAEVAQLGCVVWMCEEYIVRLQISVQNPQRVHILTRRRQPTRDRVIVHERERLRKWREQKPMQVCVHPLKHERERGRGEEAEAVDDVGVCVAGEEGGLTHKRVPHIGSEGGVAELLHCYGASGRVWSVCAWTFCAVLIAT